MVSPISEFNHKSDWDHIALFRRQGSCSTLPSSHAFPDTALKSDQEIEDAQFLIATWHIYDTLNAVIMCPCVYFIPAEQARQNIHEKVWFFFLIL